MTPLIEKMKTEYTDKYVAVDASRAELARFKDLVGQVKTVNMSGRALVEFLDYNLSTGWIDIDLDYLKVVDKPVPKPKEEKKPAAKSKAKPAAKKGAGGKPAAGGEKKLSPLEMARQQGGPKAGGAKPAGKKPSSTADILAAARGGDQATKSVPAEKAGAGEPAKVDRSKMSVADMLAMARGEKAGGDAPAESAPEPEAVEESPAEEAAAPASGASVGPVDKSSMSIDDMLAYCREHDA